ncbi:MAG TPA: amino acid ABC transporter substrate-binding protein [Ktedonobacteraceae bacterium]|nr:amino acid ABC transporter substrate-binding protein [Ktedonobacteraceae bacterium]
MFKASTVRRRTWLSIVSSLIMIFAGLSACAQSQNSGPTTNTTTLNTQNPVVIGISLSLTKNNDNDFSSDGQLMKQGYQLWADNVNSNGGLLGREVMLKILDDNSNPDLTTKNYETLINDKVDLLLGPFSSLLTKAAEKAKGIDKFAFVEGAGGAPSVFANGWNNLFAVSLPVESNLDTFSYDILSLPLSQRQSLTAAYLSSDDPFTFPQVVRAEKLLKQGGIKTVYTVNPDQQYPEGDPKAPTADAAKIVRSKADIVVLGTLLPDIQAEIAVFKQMHYHPKAIIATAGPDLGQDFIKAIGGVQYTEGMFVPNGWYPQADNFQNAAMVQAYIARYGGTADQVNADVAEAYSAGQVLQQAVAKTRSIDNGALITELHSQDVFNTVQGTAKFAPDGQNEQALAYLFQWQAGQLTLVYPLSVAAENPEYAKYAF